MCNGENVLCNSSIYSSIIVAVITHGRVRRTFKIISVHVVRVVCDARDGRLHCQVRSMEYSLLQNGKLYRLFHGTRLGTQKQSKDFFTLELAHSSLSNAICVWGIRACTASVGLMQIVKPQSSKLLINHNSHSSSHAHNNTAINHRSLSLSMAPSLKS